MNKKLILSVLITVCLLCSCSTVSKSGLPYFANFGHPGEVVLTCKAKYYVKDVPCMERITLVSNQNDEICGLIEGYYNKFILKQVVKNNNIELNGRSDFDYIYFGFGKTFFSTVDAQNLCDTRVLQGASVIDSETAERMKKADMAIYANQPNIGYPNLSRLLLVTSGESFSLEIETSSEKTASSLSKLIRSDFNSFETKNGVSFEVISQKLEENFFVKGNTVCINDLEAPDYLENWVRRIYSNGNC